jgi:hypothetical protein
MVSDNLEPGILPSTVPYGRRAPAGRETVKDVAWPKIARMWVMNARKAVAGFQMMEISG